MSKENVEIVRQLFDAFNEDGFSGEKAMALYDADLVFEEPPEQPAPGIARGLEDALEIFSRFDEAWEEHRSEPEEFRVIDESRILVLSIEHFRGRDGIAMQQPCGTIITLRSGKVIRVQSFWERGTALEAAQRSDA